MEPQSIVLPLNYNRHVQIKNIRYKSFLTLTKLEKGMAKIKVKDVMIWVLVIIVIVVGIVIAMRADKVDTQDEVGTEKEQIFCTQDIRECSDGSFVSRDPSNNCNFMECPRG